MHGQVADVVEAAEDQHRPWIPHITLAYTDDPSMAADLTDMTGQPVMFDRLRVAFAGEVTDFFLGDPSDGGPEQPLPDATEESAEL